MILNSRRADGGALGLVGFFKRAVRTTDRRAVETHQDYQRRALYAALRALVVKLQVVRRNRPAGRARGAGWGMKKKLPPETLRRHLKNHPKNHQLQPLLDRRENLNAVGGRIVGQGVTHRP